jgi:hypothetical protein
MCLRKLFNITKLAMPLLMLLAFLIPSASLIWRSSISHTLTLEVCTDHGVQQVQLSEHQQDDTKSSKAFDHCPLCQLQGHFPLVVAKQLFVAIVPGSIPRPAELSQVQQLRFAWSLLPSRAPPTYL